MTTILSFYAKKSGGKNTATNFILMTQLVQNGVCRQAQLNSQGKIEISDIYSVYLPNCDFFPFVNSIKTPEGEYVVDTKKIKEEVGCIDYSFADKLKQICIDVLGLTPEQCYGSDEQKNTASPIKWKDFPTSKSYSDEYMTAREVMQFVGTNIFRKMIPDCWVNATLNKIKNDSPNIALISDMRFKNEADALKKEGAFLVQLTRGITGDVHQSENDLNNYEGFDCVIDNVNMTIAEQNQAIYEATKHLGLYTTI